MLYLVDEGLVSDGADVESTGLDFCNPFVGQADFV